jgi:acetyl esterase/lipase
MNINGLMSLLTQQWQEPKLEPAASSVPSSVQITDSTATPAAVYHPSQTDASADSSTYEGSVLEVWGFDSEAYEKADKEMWDLWAGGFGAPLGGMRYGYEDAMGKLSPELAAKDWGFSIRNDALVIVAGDDPLSDEEIATLHKALANLEVPAQQLAKDVVRYLELDRGTDGVSKRLGRFDVSQKNFDQIIDMRELLLSHGENAKYGRSVIDPTNYHKLYGFGASYAIVDQIVARADDRFLATSEQRDYQTRVY